MALCSFASAQRIDARFGAGTLLTDGNSCTLNSSADLVCPEKGGTYLNLGADLLFKNRIGAAFDINWKASQGDFAGLGLPYRPILFTFNGVYQLRPRKKAGVDLFGGIGWQNTRFYSYPPTSNCIIFQACYTSSNHFVVNAGGGIRYSVWGHMFIRPEAEFFHIVDNTVNFTSDDIIRVGASIGYTFGSR